MDPANEQPADYYLLPIMDIAARHAAAVRGQRRLLDAYRFDTLDYFVALAAPGKIEVPA